jgi:NTP pyrophosphatase (non-canonical NTP hydrolase)
MNQTNKQTAGKDAEPDVACSATLDRGEPMTLNDYRDECRAAADKWYYHPVTGYRLTLNKGERLMLIVSELSEAMEGERKGLMDDKLPHRRMAEVELADALIRIFDYAGEEGYDLEGAYREKLAYNAQRADHTPEARASANGKKW